MRTEEFERALSAALHDLLPADLAATDLADRVTARTARRPRRLAAVAVVAAVVCTAAAIVVPTVFLRSSPKAAPVATPTSVAPPSCPDSAPTDPPAGPRRTGAEDELVPGVPVAVRICRYAGLAGQPKSELLAQAEVGRTPVAALTAELNAASPVERKAISCPDDTGGMDLLLFAYQDGGRLPVTIRRSGCRFATNGVRTVDSPGSALPTIDALLASPAPRHTALAAPVRSPDTPDAVWEAAVRMSEYAVRPHPATGTAVWVETTWAGWASIDHQEALTSINPDAKVYVVELRGSAAMTCVACRGLGPAPTGRFSITIFQVDGSGPNEGVLTDVDYPLASLGTVHAAGRNL